MDRVLFSSSDLYTGVLADFGRFQSTLDMEGRYTSLRVHWEVGSKIEGNLYSNLNLNSVIPQS